MTHSDKPQDECEEEAPLDPDAPRPAEGLPPRPPEAETHRLSPEHVMLFVQEAIGQPLRLAGIGLCVFLTMFFLPSNEETAWFYFQRTLVLSAALVPMIVYDLVLLARLHMDPSRPRPVFSKKPVYFTIGIFLVLALIKDTIQYQEWRGYVRYQAERVKRDKEDDARVEEMKRMKEIEKQIKEYMEQQAKSPYKPDYDDDIPKSDKPAAPTK